MRNFLARGRLVLALGAICVALPAVAGPHWTGFRRDACIGYGTREWTAYLKDSHDWEGDCARLPATGPRGLALGKAAACQKDLIAGMFGKFHVHDESCKPRWDSIKVEECSSPGKRHISSVLRDPPPGNSWEDLCKQTSIVYKGVTYPIADGKRDCRKGLTGEMWGNWNVDDASCSPSWGPAKRDECVAPQLRKLSSRLAGGTADPLADCNATSLTYQGRNLFQPVRCVDTGLTGIWGEWAIADATCPTPHWDPPKRDYCTGAGTRQYSSQLRDIPGSLSWEVACRMTGLDIKGSHFDRPTRCANEHVGGMWGEFDVADSACTRDERSAGDRKRDEDLAQMDQAMAKARDIYDQIDGYDLGHMPAGAIGSMLRGVLEGSAVRGGGYDVAAYLTGAGGAVGVGYAHAEGFAMSRDANGRFTCYPAWTNTFTGGIALGVSGSATLELVRGGIDAFSGDSNGFQGTATYGAGVGVGVHWTATHNPIDPMYNVIDFAFAAAGVDIGFEYAHGVAGVGPPVDCSTLP